MAGKSKILGLWVFWVYSRITIIMLWVIENVVSCRLCCTGLQVGNFEVLILIHLKELLFSWSNWLVENCALRADDVERVSTYEEFFTLDMCIKWLYSMVLDWWFVGWHVQNLQIGQSKFCNHEGHWQDQEWVGEQPSGVLLRVLPS